MPAGPQPPSDRPRDESSAQSPGRRVRFEQARSLGILFVLTALLGLVVYNTLAEGTPWVHRDRDVRLLMTLLSLLLGLDMLIGNRRELAGLLGRVLVTYADDGQPDDQRARNRDRDRDRDRERGRDRDRGRDDYGTAPYRPGQRPWDETDAPHAARDRESDTESESESESESNES